MDLKSSNLPIIAFEGYRNPYRFVFCQQKGNEKAADEAAFSIQTLPRTA